MIIDDFILRALIAGLCVAVMTGGLGVFILWRRMVYFGDTISHASLLGVSLGFLLGVSINIGIIVISLLVALLMVYMQRKRSLGNDTMLGILAHSALSLGLITMGFIEGVQIDLNAWLFGDILAVSYTDLVFLLLATVVVCGILGVIWQPLLSLTVDEDLACVEGVKVTQVGLLYTALIALTVAVTMKVIGALLISSMLIIPAAAARRLVTTPERMALMAIVIGIMAVLGGMLLSWFWDTPAGPSIVMVATTLFIVIHFIPPFQTG
ncbi:MAG TPA: hypothetical protein ENJ33_02420 [Thiothrix sp.]|nr:hypothetical protein [Thiothrix sp.]